MHWLDRVCELLQADTVNLRHLAILAGGNPAVFYQAADLTNADFRGQDLRGMSFEGASLGGVLIDSETVMDQQLLLELERQGVRTDPIKVHPIDDDLLTARAEQYPTIPLRDQVVFPHAITPLFLGRPKSIASVREVTRTKKQIFLVSQRRNDDDEPGLEAIHTMGVLANVLQHLDNADGSVKVLVEATARAKVKRFAINDHYFEADIEAVPDEVGAHDEIEALARSTIAQFVSYVRLNKKISPEVLGTVSQIDDYSKLADYIASHLRIKLSELQEILEITTVSERLERIYMQMENEIDVLQEEKKILSRANRWAEANMAKHPFDQRIEAILKELATLTAIGEPTFLSAKSHLVQYNHWVGISDEMGAHYDSETLAHGMVMGLVQYDSEVGPVVTTGELSGQARPDIFVRPFPVGGYSALADLLERSLAREIPEKQETPEATTASEGLHRVEATARVINTIYGSLCTQLRKNIRRPYLNELVKAIQEQLGKCQVETRLYDHLNELMRDTQEELEGLSNSGELQIDASQNEYCQLERLEGLVRELKKRIIRKSRRHNRLP